MAGEICGAIFIPTRPLQSSVCTLEAGHDGKHSFSTALTLARRLAEVERERDEVRGKLGDAVSEGASLLVAYDTQAARLATLKQAADDRARELGELEESVETWDCSESWEHEGDCIDNADGTPDDCLRCHVLRTLRAAMGEEKNDG